MKMPPWIGDVFTFTVTFYQIRRHLHLSQFDIDFQRPSFIKFLWKWDTFSKNLLHESSV